MNGNYAGKVINAITAITGTSGGSASGGSSTGGSSLTDVNCTATGTVINVQSNLNVRKGPGTNYDSIGKLYGEDTVDIVAENGEWYKINFGSGYGYVSKKYIQTSPKKDPTPVSPDGKSLDKALYDFNSLLGKLGFKTTVKADRTACTITTPLYVITASIGFSSELSVGNSNCPFSAEFSNGKSSLSACIPINQYANIQSELGSMAATIDYGNTSIKINPDQSVEMEISVPLVGIYKNSKLYYNIKVDLKKPLAEPEVAKSYAPVYSAYKAITAYAERGIDIMKEHPVATTIVVGVAVGVFCIVMFPEATTAAVTAILTKLFTTANNYLPTRF